MEQNYPNPFNISTTIKYVLPIESNLEIKIYDIIGKEIKSFKYNSQAEGYYNINWDGSNNFKEPVSSGIYLYQLKSNNFVSTRKMILIK